MRPPHRFRRVATFTRICFLVPSEVYPSLRRWRKLAAFSFQAMNTRVPFYLNLVEAKSQRFRTPGPVATYHTRASPGEQHKLLIGNYLRPPHMKSLLAENVAVRKRTALIYRKKLCQLGAANVGFGSQLQTSRLNSIKVC